MALNYIWAALILLGIIAGLYNILETCLAYDYVLVDNQEVGKSPALGIWYVPNEKDMNKRKFIWTALENRELVSYTYNFKNFIEPILTS